MSQDKSKFIDWIIARSFATKTAILLFGAVLIIAGTELRASNPVIGYLLISIGLLTDWAIVYIVYREISRIRDNIQQTQAEIEQTKQEMEDIRARTEQAFDEIMEAKDMAEEAKGWQ